MNRSRTSDAPRRHPLRARRAHLAGLGGAAALAVAATYDPAARRRPTASAPTRR